MAHQIENLTVDELFEFVSTTLGMPDVAKKFREQDIDGAAIPQLTTSLIREFIPTLSLGKCLEFFRKMKEQCRLNTVETPLQKCNSLTSINTSEPSQSLPSPNSSSLPSGKNDVKLSSLEGSFCPTNKENHVFIKSKSPHFPIEKLVIPPDGKKMIDTGKPSIAGKSAITTSVVTLLLELSPSSCYVSFEWKRKAAVALLENYPTLTFGMGLKESMDAWHHMFSNKLVNWRKRGKLVSDETKAKKLKYIKQASAGAKVSISRGKRKSKLLPISMFAPDNSLMMEDDQNELFNELGIHKKNRNKNLVQQLSKSTFPRLQQLTTESDIHTSKLLTEWPFMKLDYAKITSL